ncbi:GNAT family N-acetyltransferase [Herbaspirillum rubrisubalbicans]|uniref:GNAT family N-acetyltransferase n=1 Tax=Herbaspirillum rubrisubalbicans TaxID=80842 RepID=UPI00155859E9|nr:GNAT family N-acetyltransferase [Herbaspirillum rubrisubalbicans]NQE50101.1 hypothetical protein [Herbaspirillum rubrisubalbicans]
MKNKPLKIKPACIEDLPFAKTLVRSNMHPYYVEHEMEWSDAGFHRGWESNSGFIAFIGDARVGYFSVRREPGVLYLPDMQVISERCGQGIGRSMMRFIMDELLTDDSRTLRLKVFKGNPAIHFYKKLGFIMAFSDERFSGMEYKAAQAAT